MTRILLNPGRRLGVLDRRVFGGFVEHLGRCIYGGLYEWGSSLSDVSGFRSDVSDHLKALRLGVLRWPGGNFASTYHFADGIGPNEDRPRRVDLAWGGDEPNHFGTDEFLAYCDKIGTEPYICLNMGTGTLDEALAWIEYCNSSRQTYWAEQRRNNGRKLPYGVSLWALGNEMYGDWQVGSRSATEYVSEATRWARAIRMLDPDAKLVSCGMSGWNEWDRFVIDKMAGLVDFHSIHFYSGSEDYWANVLQPHQVERAIELAAGMIRRAAYEQGLAKVPRVAVDEWNVWFRTFGSTNLEERYQFADALAVGTYLNIFIRNCAWVKMANLAQMVNAIAPIVTTPSAAALQPIYYPFLLHSEGALDEAVDAYVSGPTVELPSQVNWGIWEHRIDDLAPFALVDVAATVDRNRTKLSLALVNRGDNSAERVEVELLEGVFGPNARIRVLAAASELAKRVLPDVEPVNLEEVKEAPRGEVLVLDLPPRSFTMIETTLQ